MGGSTYLISGGRNVGWTRGVSTQLFIDGRDSLRVKREVACVWLMMQLLVMS